MKKALSIFLSLILLLGLSVFVNPTAAAAEAVEAVTAYITVTLQDEDGTPVFAEARDGSQVAVKAVTVSDQDGDGMLTVYDMLYCAHVQLAPGGANDFSTVNGSRNTVSAKTLWNCDAADFTIVGGKQVNFHSQFKRSLKYPYSIVNGYHLYLIQNQKTDFFSGKTIKNGADGSCSGAQASQITAMKDQEFTLGLYLVDTTQTSPAKNLAKASGRAVYYKKGNDSAQLAGTTDKTGKIKCTLTEAGDYFFYSAPDDNAISPAVCVVHVLEQRPTIEAVSLTPTEGGENILSAFSSATHEYTITIPDGTTTLYGQVIANAEQAGVVNWYSQKSTDGASWNSNPGVGITDGDTVTTVSVDGANKIKLYLNDRQLYASGDQPLSEEYVFTIKRQVQLTGLETSGQIASSADYKTGALDVYVSYDATKATLTPTAADGDTITVDGTLVTSGSTASIALTGQETTVTITVHRDGESYVDGSYTVTFHKADAAAEPVFRENLTPELLEYITGDYSVLLKTLYVLADANGDVSYQWYYNTTDSTEGGTAIPDATDRSFLPPVDQATNRYYYCVASNGAASTASATVHVIVYDASVFSIDWDMTIPDVPEDQADLFEGSEKGFYYQKGDTDITPLRVKLTLPEGFAEKFQNGTASVSFHWEIGGYSTPTDVPEYTPDTSIAYGLRNWNCIPYIKFADRFYTVTQGTAYTTKVSVYVDRAGDHVPSDIAWEGDGTEASPYELNSQSDLETLREFVSQGYDFAETYLLMTSDIELNDQWISIGEGEGTASKGVGWKPFSGILDGGNHVLTYAEGTDQPLFKFVREATVKNLTISAPYLKNYGLVSDYAVDYGDDGDYSAGIGGSYDDSVRVDY